MLMAIQEPSPADIRPLPVLKQTLQLLKAKWKENHNYAYAVDQFKSMRQDLTVSLASTLLEAGRHADHTACLLVPHIGYDVGPSYRADALSRFNVSRMSSRWKYTRYTPG